MKKGYLFSLPGAALWLLLLAASSPYAQTPPAAETPERLFAQNRFREARAAYESALRRSPVNVALHNGYVRTLFRLDAWPEALHEARQNVHATPEDPEAHALYALALLRSGQPDAARSEAARSLAINPDDYEGLVATARLQAWDYAREAARANLRHAIRLHPERPDAWFALSDVSGDDVTLQDFDDIQHYLQLHPKGHPHDLAMEALPSRVAFMRDFLTDQPYHAIRPQSEAQFKAADSGEGAGLTFTTPIERADQYVMLPSRLTGADGTQGANEAPFKLLFDTGGGFSLTLKKKATERLKLHSIGNSIVRGVSGKEPSALYKGKGMTVGELTLAAIPIESVNTDVGPGDGVFGVTNLDKYAVTLDFEANTLTLTRGKNAFAQPARASRECLTFPFHYADGNIFLPATIEGRKVWMLVDSGADSDVILSLRLARELALKRAAGSYKESTVSGRMGFGTSDTKTTMLLFREPVVVTIGGEEKGSTLTEKFQPAFGASPLDTQVSPAMDMEIGGILGIGWLTSAKRVTFDYPHRLLTLELPERTRQKPEKPAPPTFEKPKPVLVVPHR